MSPPLDPSILTLQEVSLSSPPREARSEAPSRVERDARRLLIAHARPVVLSKSTERGADVERQFV
jgi:hypothetical protein